MHAAAPRARAAARSPALPAPKAQPRRDNGPAPAARRCACGGRCPRCGTGLQARLAIGPVDDPLEREADRVARRVTTPGAGPVGELSRAPAVAGDAGAGAVQAGVTQATSGAGRPMDRPLRQQMEARFGRDFSQVRLHTGAAAVASAASLGAQAYTVGRDIVFGAGQLAPHTAEGRGLLAHELAHVVQQSAAAAPGREAASPRPVVQRFADVDHRVLETAALKDVFTEEQRRDIEKGNMQRDYSQLPAFVNALLLGRKDAFGGYERHEHFDNFVFDRAADRWVSQDEFDRRWDDQARQWVRRTEPAVTRRGGPRRTPLQYIERELIAAVEHDMPGSRAFEHLGNVFHTTEDFFAHSNFVELTLGDRSHGDELATHTLGAHGPSSDDSILGSVSDPASAAMFNERFGHSRETASSLSHGNLAKDFHGNPNHMLAVTLAALVIRQVGQMAKEAFALGTRAQREAFVRGTIVATLTRYFRPPSDRDRWWESMLADDRGQMRRRIQALQQATPVTVNQAPGSPSRNFEATRFSPLKAIGMGTSMSFSLGERRFLTIGHMLYLPGSGGRPVSTGVMLPPYVSDRDEHVRLVTGLQFTGTFDESKWFK